MTSFNLYHLLTGSKSKKVTLGMKTSTYEFLENTVRSRDGRTREKIVLHGPKAPVVLRLLECSCVAAVLLPPYRKLCTCIPGLHRSAEAGRCHHCCRCCWSRSPQVLCCELCCWNHCLGRNPGAYICLLVAASVQKCCHKQEKMVSFPLHFP